MFVVFYAKKCKQLTSLEGHNNETNIKHSKYVYVYTLGKHIYIHIYIYIYTCI